MFNQLTLNFANMQHISLELFSFLGTGKESGRQPDTPLSLGTQADKEVSSAQLVIVAEEIAGIWVELASCLSPELFPMRKIKEIERDHIGSFSQARAMLERWSKVFGRQANCRLLIQSLCQMGQRAVASEVFGTELVGLQKVDKSVFGHIQDCTLSKPEAGASLPETVHLEGKTRSTPGEQIVLVSHCRDSIGLVGFADMLTRNFQVTTLSYCTLNGVVLCIELLSENKVFQAVLKLGVAQWHSIGLQMGLTGPQIKACTFDIPSLSSNLEALIEQKIRECGVEETEKCLLCACERIPEPIIGSVMDFIKSGSSGISEHESVQGRCQCLLLLVMLHLLLCPSCVKCCSLKMTTLGVPGLPLQRLKS